MGFIYQPSQERQIKPSDPFGRFNCGPTATAVAIDRATLGGVMVNAQDVRAATNEPIPDPASPGTTMTQLVDAAKHWNIILTEVQGGTFEALRWRLEEGRGVILSGLGTALGPDTCQPGFKGAHAIYLNNLAGPAKDKIVVYNPLCTSRRYLAVATVRKYALAYGAINNGKIRYAYTRVTPNVTKLS